VERKLIHKLRKKGFVGPLFRPVKRKHVQILFNQLGITNTKENPRVIHPAVLNQPCRILVVDDNHNNLEFASLLLKKLGFNCSLAGSGKEALQILKEVQYDILFVDIQMPNMNGYEVTRKIRDKQLKKGQPPIVIVAMTAGALAEERNRALQSGMDGFIAKPVMIKDMKDILERFVPDEKRPKPNTDSYQFENGLEDIEEIKNKDSESDNESSDSISFKFSKISRTSKSSKKKGTG